jgi:5-methylcytosine-specific restriction protein B
MAKLTGIPEDTFAAMQRIRETTLVMFNSLFSPEKQLWTLKSLRQLHELFVERYDSGEGSFLEKWKKQLEGANDDIYQLAAEFLYVQQFFTRVTGPEKKLENVNIVLSWCAHPTAIPEWAIAGIKSGLAHDQSFNQHRPNHLAWLIEFMIHWQALPENDRVALLSDPWRFAGDVRSVEFSRGAYQPMQEAWLFIVFPDTFESISSRKDKKRIRDAFSDRLADGPTGNIDSDLLEIRNKLTVQEGAGFHFYRSPLVERWRDANFSENDIDLIRQSRVRDKYTDFSVDEKAAYKRVHESLRRLGQIAVEELGGPRDYGAARKITPLPEFVRV